MFLFNFFYHYFIIIIFMYVVPCVLLKKYDKNERMVNKLKEKETKKLEKKHCSHDTHHPLTPNYAYLRDNWVSECE